jgi:dTDP-4-amino-4,6-dideoxygalactose transaminase
MQRLRSVSADVLALRGGTPVRPAPPPLWPPQLDAVQADELLDRLQYAPSSTRQHVCKSAFEKEFAVYCGVRHAVAVNSGTTALDLAVHALALPADSVVVAADYGHPSTIHYAARHHRLRLVDIAADSCCLDPDAVAAALEDGGVGCVLTTHFAGQPAGVTALAELCARYAVPLIEDAAHAHGAKVAGKRAGAFGAFGCFSLHDTKAVPAGEGGVVVTDDEALVQKVWQLHDIGRSAGAQPYDFIGLGGNFRLSEIGATLASLRLRRLQSDMARREAAAEQVRRQLPRDAPVALLPRAPGIEAHGYHFLATRYRPEYCHNLTRTRFILAVNAEGIPCNPGWPRPLHALPGIRSDTVETPKTTAAIAEAVWFDQRLLLDPDGPGQIVEAVLRVQKLAHTLTRSR